ncbi:low molecular weight protein arginine phosphatase [Rubeoparvulum massiliense]|uniref:low molecular weight protein arginine phosphatase n=1 Tax=Rubeoparvulum massiliense TaxID=1631346 RepID=UPI000A66AAEA|nr:low molecular weight protein arginine phosphatase [Rubeoparvulum massiliense]
MNVLFICTGNTCRSPTAEILLREKARQASLNIQVKSAGIATMNGLPLSVNSSIILERRNLEINHQSQVLTEELVIWADLILTMTANHKMVISSQYPFAQQKTYTLLEYALKDEVEMNALDIIDPFGGDLNLYLQVTQQMEACIDKLVADFKENLTNENGESKIE